MAALANLAAVRKLARLRFVPYARGSLNFSPAKQSLTTILGAYPPNGI
jgi:hypothetical protein